MLHSGILPNHKLWEKFFSNLKFVVLDEAHTYRGVFGSHVGCILRRLLRIARHYGSEPMFICCSATIGNPKEHVKRLTTVDMEVISGTGAPTGEKHVVCWLPPLNKEKQQRNTYREAAKIVSVLIQANLQILVFVEARKLAEIVCHLIRAKLIKSNRQDLVEKVDCYRAGYSKEERIILERVSLDLPFFLLSAMTFLHFSFICISRAAPLNPTCKSLSHTLHHIADINLNCGLAAAATWRFACTCDYPCFGAWNRCKMHDASMCRM
jgi:ATP-dependent helicase YprA (DUF1998 family)